MATYQTNYQETYTQAQLKDLKERLEVSYKARLSRLRPPHQMIIRCRNEECLFRFDYVEVAKDSYVLSGSFSMHLAACELDSEDLAFQRNRKRILDLQGQLTALLRQRQPIYGLESPGKVLEVLTPAGQTPFIYEDVTCPELRRRLKKKFDNVVADAKRDLLKNPKPKNSSTSTDCSEDTPPPMEIEDPQVSAICFEEMSAQPLPMISRNSMEEEFFF